MNSDQYFDRWFEDDLEWTRLLTSPQGQRKLQMLAEELFEI